MPRIRTLTLQERVASESMEGFLANPTKKKARTKNPRVAKQAKTIDETKAMMKSDDWSTARPGHLIALYTILHEMVYDIAPELKTDELIQAKQCAGTFLKSKCGGDFTKAVAFMKWVWAKERKTEKWRRENKVDGKIIGWRLILRYPTMWTNYKIGQERRNHG